MDSTKNGPSESEKAKQVQEVKSNILDVKKFLEEAERIQEYIRRGGNLRCGNPKTGKEQEVKLSGLFSKRNDK